jgi:hypothetical protein
MHRYSQRGTRIIVEAGTSNEMHTVSDGASHCQQRGKREKRKPKKCKMIAGLSCTQEHTAQFTTCRKHRTREIPKRPAHVRWFRTDQLDWLPTTNDIHCLDEKKKTITSRA